MFDTSIDSERGLVVHTARSGTITIFDIGAAGRRLLENLDFHDDYAILWDLRAGTVEGITLRDIIELDPALVAVANQTRPAGRTAWVPATELGGAILKLLYQQHPWSAEWGVFMNIDEAIAWCLND